MQHIETQKLTETKNYHSQSGGTVRRSAEGHLFSQQKATDEKRNTVRQLFKLSHFDVSYMPAMSEKIRIAVNIRSVYNPSI